MLGLLTIAVFVLVSAATALFAARSRTSRARALDRLSARSAAPAAALPSPALLWRELVSRIGAVLPAAPRDLPRVKRRLVRAGFRNPAAAGFLQGARLVASVLLGIAGTGGGAALGRSHRQAPDGHRRRCRVRIHGPQPVCFAAHRAAASMPSSGGCRTRST